MGKVIRLPRPLFGEYSGGPAWSDGQVWILIHAAQVIVLWSYQLAEPTDIADPEYRSYLQALVDRWNESLEAFRSARQGGDMRTLPEIRRNLFVLAAEIQANYESGPP